MRIAYLLLLILLSKPVFGQTAVADSIFIFRQADSLLQLSVALGMQGDFDKALEVIAAAEKLTLDRFKRDSELYGKCTSGHGMILLFKQDFPEAEKWYLETKSIREIVLGKEHPGYVNILHNLAILYDRTGDYEKAEQLLLESNAIHEKVLGKDRPSYAKGLAMLANIYATKGDYEKAELLMLEAKIIREKILGKHHPEYSGCLNDLAGIYFDMGIYEKAEPLMLEAIIIREKTLGKDDSEYIAAMNNLTILYTNMGVYEKAELICLEAKAIQEKTPGIEQSASYATTLKNLANLFHQTGNYEKAEPLHLEANGIMAKVMGKESQDYASGLTALASFYFTLGNYEKVEALLFEAIAIWKKLLGKEHPQYALNLSNLAAVYLQMGQYEQSELLQLEAKSIQEKVLGKENHNYAGSLVNLAVLNVQMGKYGKAEALCLEAKIILEKALGKEHPDYIANLSTLTDLYERIKRFPQADSLLKESMNLEQARLLRAVTYLSEQEMEQFTASFQASGNRYGAFLLARPDFSVTTEKDLLPGLLYDHALFHKGFLLNNAGRLRTLASSSPESGEINLRLKGYRRRLSAEYAKSIAERKNVYELEEKVSSAEKELARTVAGYAEASRPVNWQGVQSALKPGEAAIEFIRFQVNFPKKTDSTMYAVLMLRPGEHQPEFIPLFEEKSLDSMLASSAARKADYVNAVYGFKTVANNSKALKTLYELLWHPLEKDLAGIRTVYFSPSGLLHRLNVNAIPINEKETLSDRYHLVEMGSTRQLVISSESVKRNTDSGKALLFGGVQYDLNADSLTAQNIDFEPNITGTRGELSFSYTDSTDRGGTWNYLKWTDKEVTALEPILKSANIKPTVLKGYSATEEAFKSIGVGQASPRILHIATHGFFFPDPALSKDRQSLSRMDAEPSFKISEHPMIRSGLILAGANQAWKTGKPFMAGMEDGILTAYEISQMDLSNTELVVLSACETGLGDIQGNEGVYGLQRAFKIAGAKYLIMSLWQVPDFQTQELMTVFYTNWLTRQMSIPDAFRSAQQTMREKYEHPYFWAGFVLVE